MKLTSKCSSSYSNSAEWGLDAQLLLLGMATFCTTAWSSLSKALSTGKTGTRRMDLAVITKMITGNSKVGTGLQLPHMTHSDLPDKVEAQDHRPF